MWCMCGGGAVAVTVAVAVMVVVYTCSNMYSVKCTYNVCEVVVRGQLRGIDKQFLWHINQ